jgi:hypothetical protein
LRQKKTRKDGARATVAVGHGERQQEGQMTPMIKHAGFDRYDGVFGVV